MAVVSLAHSKSMILEVQKGTDSNGDPTYTNKTFSGVKEDATTDKIYATANAIRSVLSAEVRGCYVLAKSAIMNDGE